MGEQILAALSEAGVPVRGSRLLNLGSGILENGAPDDLRRKTGLDGEGIARAASEICHGEDQT
jgi:hypothetical protein